MTMSFHRQLSLQSILLMQSNRIHLSHPPTPGFWDRKGCLVLKGSNIEKGLRDRMGCPVPKGSDIEKGLRYQKFWANMYLASYFTPDYVAVDMGVFPSAEVREYAYDGLYSMVYLGMALWDSPIMLLAHRSITCFCDDDVAKTNARLDHPHQFGSTYAY